MKSKSKLKLLKVADKLDQNGQLDLSDKIDEVLSEEPLEVDIEIPDDELSLLRVLLESLKESLE